MHSDKVLLLSYLFAFVMNILIFNFNMQCLIYFECLLASLGEQLYVFLGEYFMF